MILLTIFVVMLYLAGGYMFATQSTLLSSRNSRAMRTHGVAKRFAVVTVWPLLGTLYVLRYIATGDVE